MEYREGRMEGEREGEWVKPCRVGDEDERRGWIGEEGTDTY